MTKKSLKKICVWSLILLLIGLTAPEAALAIKEPTYGYNEESANYNAFVVEVNSELEVCEAAGYENKRVTFDNKKLVLSPGDKVAGISSVTTKWNELWYEVRWVEDGVEFHGWIFSGYKNGKWIGKYAVMTEEKASNIPTPTLTPTPTLSPTPEPPTDTPTPTAETQPVQTTGNFPLIPFVLIIGVMVILAALAYYYLVVKKNKNKNTQSGEEIKRLKKAADRNSAVEREKKLYENVAGGTKASQKEGLGQGVYVVKSRDEEELTDPSEFEGDDRLQKIAINVKEKEIIRRELEALDTRDMVYHKYFGEGQVMDNSDVNNVEVKFNNHGIMYIDKEEAARKALMRKL